MKWPFLKQKKSQKGLRYKLMLAFSLMSIIPLLACMYLISNFIFPQFQHMFSTSAIMVTALVISILGLGFAKGLIDPVIDMAIEARIIASGAYDRQIAVSSDDEVGNLGESINVMTQRIKNNLDELKTYGQKTREINAEIHKKILALSSLLQIGDIISTGSMKLDSVLDFAIQKVAMIFDTGFGVLYMARPKEGDYIVKASYNIEDEKLVDIVIKESGQGILEKALENRSILVIDDTMKDTKVIENLKNTYNVKNLLALPIFSGKRSIGLLVVGNRLSDFKYKPDDIDLVKVFTKQVTIAVENDILIKRAEELAIIDELTGLFNRGYILSRLEEEIKRAIFYQRPCSFIMFNIDNFKLFRESKGELVAEDVLKKASRIVRENSTPMGKVGRIGGDEFVILLPEKNKREATLIAEDIRKKIETANFAKEGKLYVTISAGVSENPIDGSTREELFKKAMDSLHSAKSLGKNKVVA